MLETSVLNVWNWFSKFVFQKKEIAEEEQRKAQLKAARERVREKRPQQQQQQQQLQWKKLRNIKS